MRLIDADPFFNDFPEMRDYEYASQEYEVDAVEVVRCKDCKFFDHSDFGKGEEYWCKHFVSTYGDSTRCHIVIEDDFCSWGERKGDETN